MEDPNYFPLPSCLGDSRPGRYLVEEIIEEDIVPLVNILNSPVSVTFSHSRGHDEDELDKTDVELAVYGMEGLEAILLPLQQWFQLLDNEEILVDLEINWNPEVGSACDFENHPGWISLSLVACDHEGNSLSKRQIEILADIFKKGSHV